MLAVDLCLLLLETRLRSMLAVAGDEAKIYACCCWRRG